MLLLGRDLHHGAEGLPGLDVGEAFTGRDLPQAEHVGGCHQQVAGGVGGWRRGGRETPWRGRERPWRGRETP